MTYGSTPVGDDDPAESAKAVLQREEERTEQVTKARTGSHGRALSGWLTVRRHFKPSTSNTTGIFATTTRTTDLSGAELHPESDKEREEEVRSNSGAATTYSARIAQTYRQMVESRQAKKDNPPKEFFFCVLKGSVLFLYEDEAQSDCVAAIGVDKYLVGMEGSDGELFKGKDAEMFAKRNALVMRIAEKDKMGKEKMGLPVLMKTMSEGDGGKDDDREMENAPWFLFSKSNTK